MADTNITADVIEVVVTPKQSVVSHYPAAARDSGLDQYFDLSWSPDDPSDVDPRAVYVTVTGDWFNESVVADFPTITVTPVGTGVFGGVWGTSTPPTITLSIPADSSDVVLEQLRKNWLKWSNIGSLDFTIWKDNVAGERPIDLRGWCYEVKKLGNKVVYYSENGVAFLSPSGVHWGLQIVSRIGVRSKQAICGNDQGHFYVDREGRLCRVGEGIEVLDYSEYIDQMLSNLVLSLDELNQRVYICDGLVGYVYDIASKSFAEGPANITGIGVQDGSLLVAASSAISVPAFSMCTDIYDMGNRKQKTIHYLDIGADLTNALYAAIDYRFDKSRAFATTPWTIVNPNGRANLPCGGVEFRFRLKALVYEQFELDYIRAVGILHDYSWLDSFSSKG